MNDPIRSAPPKDATPDALKKYAAIARADRKRREENGVSDYQLLAEELMNPNQSKKDTT